MSLLYKDDSQCFEKQNRTALRKLFDDFCNDFSHRTLHPVIELFSSGSGSNTSNEDADEKHRNEIKFVETQNNELVLTTHIDNKTIQLGSQEPSFGFRFAPFAKFVHREMKHHLQTQSVNHHRGNNEESIVPRRSKSHFDELRIEVPEGELEEAIIDPSANGSSCPPTDSICGSATTTPHTEGATPRSDARTGYEYSEDDFLHWKQLKLRLRDSGELVNRVHAESDSFKSYLLGGISSGAAVHNSTFPTTVHQASESEGRLSRPSSFKCRTESGFASGSSVSRQSRKSFRFEDITSCSPHSNAATPRRGTSGSSLAPQKSALSLRSQRNHASDFRLLCNLITMGTDISSFYQLMDRHAEHIRNIKEQRLAQMKKRDSVKREIALLTGGAFVYILNSEPAPVDSHNPHNFVLKLKHKALPLPPPDDVQQFTGILTARREKERLSALRRSHTPVESHNHGSTNRATEIPASADIAFELRKDPSSEGPTRLKVPTRRGLASQIVMSDDNESERVSRSAAGKSEADDYFYNGSTGDDEEDSCNENPMQSTKTPRSQFYTMNSSDRKQLREMRKMHITSTTLSNLHSTAKRDNTSAAAPNSHLENSTSQHDSISSPRKRVGTPRSATHNTRTFSFSDRTATLHHLDGVPTDLPPRPFSMATQHEPSTSKSPSKSKQPVHHPPSSSRQFPESNPDSATPKYQQQSTSRRVIALQKVGVRNSAAVAAATPAEGTVLSPRAIRSLYRGRHNTTTELPRPIDVPRLSKGGEFGSI